MQELEVDTFNILNIKVQSWTLNELHKQIEAIIDNNQHELVLNVNVNCLNLSYDRIWLQNFLNSAKIVFCDGVGVMLGARILGQHIPERITFAEWTWQISQFAANRDFSFYFLGAKPGVAEKAAVRLKERYPNLNIVGIHHGYYDKSPNSPENQAVIREINSKKPNILLLGFGMPLQERWLFENWDKVEANIALTGGAVFDYVSGELRRGPKLLTDNGFEWLARLMIEPQRLWRRYILGNPLFIWRVLKQRFGLIHSHDFEDSTA
jgi:N-acetylglucosaminyldiphosphoundecaprenol N-acetyl-beta-D-mannosaminyltransferase